ncbi:hypothetical protein OJ997_15030 [Solirubrobacter phytolaccae]|uniref:Uncharacterized protein n=1 Tax=Solirubrobacter phytolaccae TaxID=1404360 RepID=A0A9X3NI32_9ACTN|nr:hypothetical protein [Solirubrobacter phytolaccae]MDA0181617.1 hypothetical protein [Solirubrobacter phytolaccae]
MTSSPSPRSPGIFFALIPWVAFSLLVHYASVDVAAVVALIASVGVALPGIVTRRPKILELGAVVAFVGITVVAFAADANTADELGRYGRGIAAALLAVIAFGSLLFTPFTEQYARESVPEAYWSSPRFKALNRSLTAMWGGVFAAMVPLHIIAGSIDTQRSNLIFNWALPVALVIWASKRTSAMADANDGNAATPVAA